MIKAKYYIYRNLRTGGFSIKHRGIVIKRFKNAIIDNVEFKINESARLRVIAEQRKNVHAFVVSESISDIDKYVSENNLQKIEYNPYKNKTFIWRIYNSNR